MDEIVEGARCWFCRPQPLPLRTALPTATLKLPAPIRASAPAVHQDPL